MIQEETIKQIAEEWLKGNEYFLVETKITPDRQILVEIDHPDGVWIEDCVALSDYIKEKAGDELDEYDLEVGSAGIDQPFKVLQQYYNHIGQEVEVLTRAGKKMVGVLKSANEQTFTVTVKQKMVPEGLKRPKMVDVDLEFNYQDISYTKYVISFK